MQWFSKTSKYFAILHAIIRKVGPTKESPINGFSSSSFFVSFKQFAKLIQYYINALKLEVFM